jgi:prepilin-type N-terminal cleavage/methylation domain-containing protein
MQLTARNFSERLMFRRTAAGSAAAALSLRRAGFTLAEVLIASAIVGVVFGGIINCYIQSGIRIQWTGYSLAAQSLANQKLEQVRSASWDPTIGVNQLTNLNLTSASYSSSNQTYTGYTTTILDVPYSGTNSTLATNYITVQMVNISGATNITMQFVRVDTVWPFTFRQGTQIFTNTISTMLAPDDRQF